MKITELNYRETVETDGGRGKINIDWIYNKRYKGKKSGKSSIFKRINEFFLPILIPRKSKRK